MAAESADDTNGASAADKIARFAELVEAVDEEGVTIVDHNTTRLASSGDLQGTIDVRIDDVPVESNGDECPVDHDELGEAVACSECGHINPLSTPAFVPGDSSSDAEEELQDVDADAEAIVDELEDDRDQDTDDAEDERAEQMACSECGESHDDGACWDETTDEPVIGEGEIASDADEEIVEAVADAVDEEDDEDEFDPDAVAAELQAGSDEEGSDADGADTEQADEFAADEPDPDSTAGAVLQALREEGELSGKELKLASGVSNIYTVVAELHDDGLVAKRANPDDGRQTLYRPAEMDVDEQADGEDQQDDDAPEWNGRDPETIVADSSLPARVVLDDILDAAESASTVIEAAETLDVDVDNLEPVCWHLTLKQPDSLEIVDDAADKAEIIREVADA